VSIQQHTRRTQLGALLSDMVMRVPHADKGVVVSSDGMLLAMSPGLDRASGDRLAAVASSLMGIATGASGPLRGGPVDEVVVQMRNSICLVTRISEEASVAVVASPRCDLAELAYEMERFANQSGPLVGRALQPELQAQLPQ
jgi:predicted regulator of Ras-like GTPase activity (Roadblock/LC7/MglB family)